MEKELTNILMEMSMKEIGNIILCMEKELTNLQMEMF